MTFAYHSNPVTLNLFQGPFLGLLRSVRVRKDAAAVLPSQAVGHAAGWMLKQVQHDDLVGAMK